MRILNLTQHVATPDQVAAGVILALTASILKHTL